MVVPELQEDYNISLSEITSLDNAGAHCSDTTTYVAYSIPSNTFNVSELSAYEVQDGSVLLRKTDMYDT